MEIIPSILTNSPEEAKAMLSLTDVVCGRTHIDVIDGLFVNNKTVFPESFEDEIYTTRLDFHLMVNEPIKWIDRCMRGNADRIIGQVEQMEDQLDFVNSVLQKGALVGLALDLPTDVLALDPEVLHLLDVVLVMSVDAGFGGQSFDPLALQKIKKLKELREENSYTFRICDDGGVSIQNEHKIEGAGADEVSIGRSLFSGDLSANIELFKKHQ